MVARWKITTETKFKRQYKNLDSQTKQKVNRAIQELTNSENPARLGKYKQNKRVFAYNIGSRHRIIYNIDWGSDSIEFLRVCDHKSAYGKD